MNFANRYLRNIAPYKVASHKIWTVDPEKREKIVKLDWNEAVIPPSPKVGERLKQLVDDGSFYNLYPAVCNAELMERLSAYVGLPAENIQYFPSSDSVHEYISRVYLTPGDPILLLGPTYDNFRLTAQSGGGEVYYYNLNKDLSFDPQGFIGRIEEIEPSLVYICNPNNPTGTQHSVEFIQLLLERYPQVLFLIDEAYAEFTNITAKNLILKYDNILISRTMSKAFALANFRFGYLLASKENIELISSIRNPKNISTFTQEAVIAALSDIPYMKRYTEEVQRAGDEFCEAMKQHERRMRCIRGGGNFLLLELNNESDKAGLLKYLTGKDIFVRDLTQTEYLRRRCVRMTIGTRELMRKVACQIGLYFRGGLE